MKRNRYSEDKIIGILKDAESGVSLEELTRKYGIAQSTFFRWKSKFGGLDVNEAARLKQLEDENRRLKKLVADQALDIQMLKDVNSKNW